MTCIAGIAENNKVYIGADSEGSNNSYKVTRKDKKLFKTGKFLIGYTTSYRMGQLLQYSEHEGGLAQLDPPKDNLHKFMVTTFVNRVRDILKDGGFMNINNSVETGGTFLIGVGGRLFQMESDLQIMESANNYDSCGSGMYEALGSLHTTNKFELNATERIELALDAASDIAIGVGKPFIIETI